MRRWDCLSSQWNIMMKQFFLLPSWDAESLFLMSKRCLHMNIKLIKNVHIILIIAISTIAWWHRVNYKLFWCCWHFIRVTTKNKKEKIIEVFVSTIFHFFSHSKHDRKFPSAREEREKWKNISRIDKRHQKLTHLKFLISKGRKSEKYSQLPVTASTSALQSFSSPNYSHILFQKCEEIVCNFSSFLAFVRVWNVKLHNMFNVMKNLNRGKHV